MDNLHINGKSEIESGKMSSEIRVQNDNGVTTITNTIGRGNTGTNVVNVNVRNPVEVEDIDEVIEVPSSGESEDDEIEVVDERYPYADINTENEVGASPQGVTVIDNEPRANSDEPNARINQPIFISDISDDDEIEIIDERPTDVPLTTPLDNTLEEIMRYSRDVIDLTNRARRISPDSEAEIDLTDDNDFEDEEDLVRNFLFFPGGVRVRYTDSSASPAPVRNTGLRYNPYATEFDSISSTNIIEGRRQRRTASHIWHANTRGGRAIHTTNSHLNFWLNEFERQAGFQESEGRARFQDFEQDQMRQLQSMLDTDNDRRINDRLREGTKIKDTIEAKELIKDADSSFTNSLKPEISVVCVLCGVGLGEGIPTDFKYDQSLALQDLQQLCKVPAPYQFCSDINEVDIDLSRRVFTIKGCGHVYCGRCIKKIVNKRGRGGRKKAKIDPNEDFKVLSCPKACVAEECGKALRGAKTFTEVFY